MNSNQGETLVGKEGGDVLLCWALLSHKSAGKKTTGVQTYTGVADLDLVSTGVNVDRLNRDRRLPRALDWDRDQLRYSNHTADSNSEGSSTEASARWRRQGLRGSRGEVGLPLSMDRVGLGFT